MNRKKLLSIVILAGLGFQSAAFADDADVPATGGAPAGKPWKDSGEFSFVNTTGNSRTTTTSAKDTFNYHWSRTMLELIGGALGASSGRQVTAEQYNASEKVTWSLAEASKNYLFENFGWDSNRFAGYRNRYDASAGYGRTIIDTPLNSLTGELGPGYVNEERIDAPRNEFASGRVHAKYTHTLSATAKFIQDVEYINDFKDSKDYRLNTDSSITASLTTHLSLKASYTWKRVGAPPIGFGKDDTTTSIALVANY